MITITNKNKVAENNINENTIKEINEYVFNDDIFGYDDVVNEEKSEVKKGWFSGFFSNLFNKDNNIKKKKYEYKKKEEKPKPMKIKKKKYKKKGPKEMAKEEYEDGLYYTQGQGNRRDYEYEEVGCYMSYDLDYGCEKEDSYGCSKAYYFDKSDFDYDYESPKYNSVKNEEKEEKKEKNEIKPIKKNNGFQFDEFIIRQDIIEGNWTKDSLSEELINLEKDMYEKIKKFAEDKGINDENGIITLFALYYIYNEEKDKLNELKFVINKAKNYVKKIFKLDYGSIVKDIEKK